MSMFIAILIIIVFITPFIVGNNVHNKSIKIFLFTMLSISMIVALLMTACGFMFTIKDILSERHGMDLIYIVSIPSIILGLIFFMLSLRKFTKLTKKHNK